MYYPRGYSTRQWEYYRLDFSAVELNATFYRWQKPETWQSWRDRAALAQQQPFVYAIKAHQYFTHWRRLTIDEAFIAKFEQFWADCRQLGPHCGPLLLQFPARFECTANNLDRLQQFGQVVQNINNANHHQQTEANETLPLRVALEFRHSSWFEEPRVFAIAKEYDLCICLVHLVNQNPAKWADHMKSGFSPPLQQYHGCSWGMYLRCHGTRGQYEGSYADDFLDELLDHCCKAVPNQLFIFFNNTDSGRPPSAIRDAKHVCQWANT